MAKLYPNVVPGAVVKVHQKIKETNTKGEEKERVQIFEGMVLARRGHGISETVTVRKVAEGVGVEKIYPLAMPSIEKIEVGRQAKVNRAKLFFLRDYPKKLKFEKEEKKVAVKKETKTEVKEEPKEDTK
jgi:large subunit ribosomal protein L19